MQLNRFLRQVQVHIFPPLRLHTLFYILLLIDSPFLLRIALFFLFPLNLANCSKMEEPLTFSMPANKRICFPLPVITSASNSQSGFCLW